MASQWYRNHLETAGPLGGFQSGRKTRSYRTMNFVGLPLDFQTGRKARWSRTMNFVELSRRHQSGREVKTFHLS